MKAVVGYVRCSTDEQTESGLGLEAQRRSIELACDQRGWHLLDVISDEGVTGANLDRPGLGEALEKIVKGEASGLVAAKLDRISRSLFDVTALLEWFNCAGAILVAADLGLDTSTAGGRLVASVFASVGEWERETTAQRTKDALSARRRQGGAISRPSVIDTPTAKKILAWRAKGLTLQAIAEKLNRGGVPTLRGGSKWRPSSVQAATGYKRPPKRHTSANLPVIPRRRNFPSHPG